MPQGPLHHLRTRRQGLKVLQIDDVDDAAGLRVRRGRRQRRLPRLPRLPGQLQVRAVVDGQHPRAHALPASAAERGPQNSSETPASDTPAAAESPAARQSRG
jgi:hypothetical protein